MAGREQRTHDGTKRRALLELLVRLPDERDVAEFEERVGVRPPNGTDDSALHKIAQVIFADRAVPPEQVAQRLVLPLERVGRGDACERQNSSSVRMRITSPFAAFSSSARRSLLLVPRPHASVPAPKPSPPITSIVVFTVTSSAVAPPRRTTTFCASRRPRELNFPVKTTSCPASGEDPGDVRRG